MSNTNWNYCGNGNNMPEKEGFYLCSLNKEAQPHDELAVIKSWYSETLHSFTEHSGQIEAWTQLPSRYVKEEEDNSCKE